MANVQDLIDRIQAMAAAAESSIVVAIDGRSGAGKSTLAAKVAAEVGAAVIEGDDFYSGGRAEEWEQMNPAERALYCIDWRRQRPVLGRLRAGQAASWFPFDWTAFDGRLEDKPKSLQSSKIVILEGVYSARPELSDLVDLTAKLDTADETRQHQLDQREGDTLRPDWSDRWNAAEDHYFQKVMPPALFSLVVSDIER